MPGVLVGLPSKNVAPTATPSWAVGTAASGYPVTNVLTLDPGLVAKANQNTATLRLTFGGSVTPVVILFIHTNWGGATSVTLSNNGGMAALPVTIRENEDGLCECGWADLRGLSGVAGTQFNVAVVGDAPVSIGTIVVLTEVESPHTQWRYGTGQWMPKVKLTPASRAQDFVFAVPTRRRLLKAVWHWAEDRPLWRSLQLEAYSVTPTPFAVIVDEDDVDAMLAQFEDEKFQELNEFFDGSFADDSQSGIVETTVDILEVGAGAPLP